MLTQEKLNTGICMPPTKIDSFMDEFKWISGYVGNRLVNCVYVQRAEPELLVYKLKMIFFDCFFGDINTPDEEMWFLNKNGEKITIKKKTTRLWRLFFGKPISKEEDISSVFYSGCVKDFVVDFWERADDVVYILSYSSCNKAVIVYKLPKNVSLKQWIKNETAAERKKILKEFS